MGPLQQLFGISVDEYFRRNGLLDLFEQAKAEEDWAKRAKLFQELNKKLIEEKFVVPGWIRSTYFVSTKGIDEVDLNFKYTPRILNFRIEK